MSPRPEVDSCEASEEVICYSVEGRPLRVEYRRKGAAPLRIFILAGQHGDESDGTQAAREYLRRLERRDSRCAIDAAVLADANPDGSAASSRRNRADADLNRDHLLLREPETLAVHEFVERWKPELILDIHTYRPRRPELLRYDLVFPQDVMIDYPTNPAVDLRLNPKLESGLLTLVRNRMSKVGFRCDRYTRVLASGIVRHSNVHILDARNGLALRYGVLTLLLEGRRLSPNDHSGFAPAEVALLRSIEAVVEWAQQNILTARRHPAGANCSREISVRCRYVGSRKPRTMEMQSATSGEIESTNLPGMYLGRVTTIRTVRAPLAYAVPRSSAGVLDLLRRQRFQSAPPDEFRRAKAEMSRVLRIPQFTEEGDPDDSPFTSAEKVRLDFDNFILFPAAQPGCRMLRLLLEAESEFGLWRIPDLIPPCEPGTFFPVGRLV